MSREIHFLPHAGGLGDSLLYSTLPEKWVRELGFEFYIVNPNWRNPGVAPLVWESNPYVSGILERSETPHMMTDNGKLLRGAIEWENNVMGAEAYFGSTG